jgi:GNAT superfamily N-acetyltransferase
LWARFEKYHYLSSTILNASQCYALEIMNKIVGICAVSHFPHPKVKNLKKIHRLVLLPEYQGLGVATLFMTYVASLYAEKGYQISITTSLKGFILSLKRNKDWKLVRYGRVSSGSGKIHNKNVHLSTSHERLTATFYYNK